jgi:D-alanine-D-alanine ligase
VLRIPYTGSRVHACVRCADKMLAKHALRDGGLPTPDWVA